MARYMQAADIEENSIQWEMAHFLLELTLPEYPFLNNSPSMLACAALYGGGSRTVLCRARSKPV